jgi:hypothetical protein
MQQGTHIKEFGKVEHLLAAYAALQTVQDRNFKMVKDFGQPYTVNAQGRCNTVCNAAGWVAQHPHFKSLGVKFEEGIVLGKKVFQPVYYMDGKNEPAAQGYNALAYALEMDIQTVFRVFSPFHYPEPYEATTVADVLKRLKGVINKAGGADSLKAHLKAQKAKSKVKKAKKAAKEPKTAKKAKKAARKG